MPSRVECENGHPYRGTCREAAIEIAQVGNEWPICKRLGCGARVRYISEQTYPSEPGRTYVYEVQKVVRFRPNTAEKDKYDPMLLVLRERMEAGDKCSWPIHIWTFYWTHNRKGQWHVGQFPPLLTVKELKEALQGLDKLPTLAISEQ